jgi:hypothetical protein
MARMSIDDALLRDPRVKDLAERLGWHRHQVIGCLLDVWAVCYDRVSPVLTQREVDFACEVSGFCTLMIATKLAAETGHEDGSVRVAGVAKRIGYLESSAERGREGGRRSGETRRAKGESKGPAKGSFDFGEGSPNPSALPSASVPDTALASVPAQPKRKPSEIPEGWSPSRKHHDLASELGVDCVRESEQFIDRNVSKGERYVDWDAAFRTWLRNAAKFNRQAPRNGNAAVVPFRPRKILNPGGGT